MNRRILTMTSIGALLASVAAAGCSPRDQSQARNDARDTVAQVEQSTKSAGRMAGDKVSDAVITTSVKAELAKDPNLSAMSINVDTDSGRVALHGSAPSPDARERATALAQGVKGVVSVDNALTLQNK